MGKGGGGGSEIDPEARAMAQRAEFKPYTLTSNTGSTTWDKKTNSFTSDINPMLSNIQDQGYGGVEGLMGQIPDSFGREAEQLNFNRDLEGRTSDIFGQQSALLAPAFAQQNQQLQNDLFGSGRMGLMMASDSAGAAGGGYVNPDAFGLGQAQSQTLANLAVNSRQQALGEQQQAYGIDSGMFGINQGMQQQRSNNLLTGAGGMLGFGEAISNREVELMRLGLTAEQARGAASSAGASALASNTQQEQQEPDLLGALVQGAATAATAAALASDMRLKTNIEKVGVIGRHNLYTWDWNEEGKKIANPDQPTVGVMAQEARELNPEAVVVGPDGYLRVKYEELT